MKIAVTLANGFEEIEAVVPIDILKRAGFDVELLYIEGKKVAGAHGLSIEAEKAVEDADPDSYAAVICPGGMPGAQTLMDNPSVIKLVKRVYEKGGHVAAICAAPRVLFAAGVLADTKATCFPGTEALFDAGVIYSDEPLVVDGRVITAKGAGVAFEFGYKIIELLKGKELSEKVEKTMFFSK